MSDQSTIVKFSTDVIFQDLEGEAVLLNLSQERYYGLDDVGVRFWQLLETHGNTNDVIAQALTEFDIDEATLRHDLTVLLSEFAEAGLVTLSQA